MLCFKISIDVIIVPLLFVNCSLMKENIWSFSVIAQWFHFRVHHQGDSVMDTTTVLPRLYSFIHRICDLSFPLSSFGSFDRLISMDYKLIQLFQKINISPCSTILKTAIYWMKILFPSSSMQTQWIMSIKSSLSQQSTEFRANK